MKKLHNDFEFLSAYIDDELTAGEKSNVEEKLLSSKELQYKLNELKRIKELTFSSIKELKKILTLKPV